MGALVAFTLMNLYNISSLFSDLVRKFAKMHRQLFADIKMKIHKIKTSIVSPGLWPLGDNKTGLIFNFDFDNCGKSYWNDILIEHLESFLMTLSIYFNS